MTLQEIECSEGGLAWAVRVKACLARRAGGAWVCQGAWGEFQVGHGDHAELLPALVRCAVRFLLVSLLLKALQTETEW